MHRSLSASRVTKRFGALTVLNDVSLRAAPGDVIAIVGHNGSGKSTLLRILSGALEPTYGDVCLGDVTSSSEEYRYQVAYVPDGAAMYPYLTGAEYIELVAKLRGVSMRRIHDRLPVWVDAFGLRDVCDRRVSTYSKGTRQKTVLCAVLLANPKIVILDEPFVGLDAAAAALLEQLIVALSGRGQTVVFSEHARDVVLRVAVKAMCLREGSVVAEGEPSEVLSFGETGRTANDDWTVAAAEVDRRVAAILHSLAS